jgi:hypothetical protein
MAHEERSGMRHTCTLALALLAGALSGCDGDDADGDADGDADMDVDADADARPDADEDFGGEPEPCIGDADAPLTVAAGSGTLTGSVGGEALVASAARGRWIVVSGAAGYSVAFLGEAGTCEEVADAAPVLVLFACDNEPGEYVVGESCAAGSGLTFPNSVRLPREAGTVEATEGTITIEAFEPQCGGEVKGSFTADFDGEAVSGSFDTISCGRSEI